MNIGVISLSETERMHQPSEKIRMVLVAFALLWVGRSSLARSVFGQVFGWREEGKRERGKEGNGKYRQTK